MHGLVVYPDSQSMHDEEQLHVEHAAIDAAAGEQIVASLAAEALEPALAIDHSLLKHDHVSHQLQDQAHHPAPFRLELLVGSNADDGFVFAAAKDGKHGVEFLDWRGEVGIHKENHVAVR